MGGATPSIVNVPGQVNQQTQAKSTQKNFRQMCGEVMQWNPDAPETMVESWINNSYRRVIDSRLWYGLMVRGQVVTPQVYVTGTAQFTLGSPTVQGFGTVWVDAMKGRQIRAGFSTGWYNIIGVDSAHQKLTLDLPWGNPTLKSGYMIVQTWVTLGYNIKMVIEMVNQRQGWRLGCNLPQAAINQWDTWRTTTGWTQILANKEPTADGQPQYELWPAPTFQQVFPFLAYTQAPDMADDESFPATFVRSDIIVLAAIKDALLFRGKVSRYYDPVVAESKEKEFKYELEKLKMNDDNLYPKDFMWDYAKFPMSYFGSVWQQSHAGGPGEI